METGLSVVGKGTEVHLAVPVSIHYVDGITWRAICGEVLRQKNQWRELTCSGSHICRSCLENLNKQLLEWNCCIVKIEQPKHEIELTDREFHTVIAALHCWQDPGRAYDDNDELENLATLDGKYWPMTYKELEQFIERLSTE